MQLAGTSSLCAGQRFVSVHHMLVYLNVEEYDDGGEDAEESDE